MYIASMAMSFSALRQASRIFDSISFAEPLHSTRCWPTCESFFWCSDIQVLTCPLECPNRWISIHYISSHTPSEISDDFRVGRHDLNFRVMNTTWKLHIFLFWVRSPLYLRKIVGLSWALVLLFWCSSGVVFNWSLLPIIIVSRVWIPFIWILIFLIQQVLFFSSAWSKANQLDVALKTLWTVSWITFCLYWSVAELQKFSLLPVSVGLWYRWHVIILSLLTFRAAKMLKHLKDFKLFCS